MYVQALRRPTLAAAVLPGASLQKPEWRLRSLQKPGWQTSSTAKARMATSITAEARTATSYTTAVPGSRTGLRKSYAGRPCKHIVLAAQGGEKVVQTLTALRLSFPASLRRGHGFHHRCLEGWVGRWEARGSRHNNRRRRRRSKVGKRGTF